jgi:hypothetical protein
MTRNGKIARLPRPVREELNQRLHHGEQGKQLVAWLNTLPEVQAIMRSDFAGRPIREQSISEWKQRGYREWLAFQQAGEIAALRGETVPQRSLEQVAAIAANELLLLARKRMTGATDEEKWQILRELSGDIDKLRRTDQSADRLDLERCRLAFEEEKRARRRAELASPTPRRRRRKLTFQEWAESGGEHFTLLMDLIREARAERSLGKTSGKVSVQEASRDRVVSGPRRSPRSQRMPEQHGPIRLDPTQFLKRGHSAGDGSVKVSGGERHALRKRGSPGETRTPTVCARSH